MRKESRSPTGVSDDLGDALDPRLPKGPRSPSLVQSLRWFRDPVGFARANHRRFGPVFRAGLGPRRNVAFVGDPALIREILQLDPDWARAGDGNGLMRPVLGSSSLLTLDGEEHRHHRRMMLPAFHGRFVKQFNRVIAEVTEERLGHWPLGEPFPVHEEMREITFTTILRIVLGMSPGPREDSLRVVFPRVMDLCSSLLTLSPYFRRELGGVTPWAELMRATDELDDLLYAEITDRRMDPGLDAREDGLTLFLRAEEETGMRLSDRELRDELVTMLVAGHETTAAALSWAFERLSRHPEVASRIARERDSGEDEYLQAVIKEVLRQRPLVPALVRKLTRPLALGDYVFPEGWVLMPSVFEAHHDSGIYPDPDEFRPERFLDEPPPAWAWIPFGGGNRRCVGASLAMVEMRIVLGTVLERVEIRSADPAPERVARRRFTLAPEHDAVVIATRRRSALRERAAAAVREHEPVAVSP
jgi:cytochrome P450 family 135